jgi:L-seryl-tRNA(Ser) seleniumtransferase
VIVQRLHRNEFTHVLTFAGAKLVEIGNEHSTSPEELDMAINEQTAAVAYFAYDPQKGVLPLERVLQISHSRGIPVVVDAAAEIPPLENLGRFTKAGADLTLFSAGKDIGAPNDTGIILGCRDLVRTCVRLGPHTRELVDSEIRNYIGRPMKTSKEDILAVVAALKRYVKTDHDARLTKWKARAEYMFSEISKCDKARVKIIHPGFGHPRPICVPRVELELKNTELTAEDVANQLRQGEMPIYTYVIAGKLYINPQCLRDGEEGVLARRLANILA